MKTFEELHKDVYNNPTAKIYKYLDVTGEPIEWWEKDKNGTWIDKMPLYKAKKEIQQAKKDLLKLGGKYES